ncbi:MAG: hypothetical protein ACI82F_004421, partial [Planctomycetota bacterium]
KPKTEGNPYGVDACILDFGIGGLIEEVEREPGAGSAPYFSPEQSRGERLDARSDLFAIGILLYEMIVGERPFKGRTAVEIGSSLQETNLVPLIEKLTGVPKPIKRILRKALQKDREARYQSAGDFIKAIEGSDSFKGGEKGSGLAGAAAVIFAASTVGLGWVAQTQYTKAKFSAAEVSSLKLAAQGEKSVSDLGGVDSAMVEGLREDVTELRNQNSAHLITISGREKTIEGLRADVIRVQGEGTSKELALGTATNEFQDDVWDLKFLNSKLQDVIQSLYVRDLAYRKIQDTKLAAADEFPRLLDDISSGSFRGTENSLNPQHMRSWVHSRSYLDQLLDLAGSLPTDGTGATTPAMIPGLRRTLEHLRGDGLEAFAREARDDSETRWLGVARRSQAEITTEIRSRVLHHIGMAQEEARQQRTERDDSPNSEAGEPGSDEQDSQTAERAGEWDPQVDEVVDANLMGQRWDSAQAEASVEQLGQVLALLESRLNEVSTRFKAESEEEKKRLLSLVGSKPELLLDYIVTHGAVAQDDLAELVTKVVETLEGTFVSADGAANIAGIRRLPAGLLELTTRLHQSIDGGSVSLGDSLEPDLLHRLCWLTMAQNWYQLAGRDNRLLMESWWKAARRGDLAQVQTSGRDRNWRATLLFQMEASARSDFFPTAQGVMAIYRVTSSSGGGELATTSWEAERCQSVDSNSGEYLVTQRELGPKGEFSERNSPRRTPKFHRNLKGVRRTTGTRQHDLVFFHDLGQGEEGVEYWRPDSDTAQEFEGVRKLNELRGISGQNLNQLIPPDTLESGYRCLINGGTNGRVFWVHPVLGVVREETRDSNGQITKVRELAHLER